MNAILKIKISFKINENSIAGTIVPVPMFAGPQKPNGYKHPFLAPASGPWGI